jgi:hypothetical protein
MLRRHQPRVVAEPGQLARPVVRAWLPAPTTGGRRGAARAAGLEADQAARQAGEERQHLAARQPPAQHHPAARIDAVHRKHALGDVETNRGNLHLGRLPSVGVHDPHLWHIDAAGGVHLIMRPWESVRCQKPPSSLDATVGRSIRFYTPKVTG